MGLDRGVNPSLTNQMVYKAGFKQSQFQMYIYYKYVPYGSRLFLLSYVDDCLYWYTPEQLGKWFVDKLGKILHVNFLVYAHLPFRILELKYHYISVYQTMYATYFI